MQSYAINQVQVLITFVPARLFVFSTLANISSSDEEASKFLFVVYTFYRYFSSHALLSKLSKSSIPWTLGGEVLLVHPLQMISVLLVHLLQMTSISEFHFA